MLELSALAIDDLRAVYLEGLDRFGQRQADLYIDGLLDTLDRLSEFPRLGVARLEMGPMSRTLAHRSHVILYRTDDSDVFVRRIRHAREDWLTDLESGDTP